MRLSSLVSKTTLLVALGLATAAAAVACSSSSANGADPMCGAPVEGEPQEVPDDLRCTGLYGDWDAQTVAPQNREFSPGSPLWSDGAEKRRWIQLPDGTKVDATKMDDWTFPIGTKTWKEFAVNGRKVETRFMWKVRADRWLQAAYVWSEDGTTAVRNEGAELEIDGKPYHVPSTSDCNSCHEGRKDKVLGFEALNLALPGATGFTLGALVDEDRISPKPMKTKVTIPDDGTGASGPALAWMHTNCGVSCHAANDSAIGGRVGLRLRLGWDDVNGARPPAEWDAYKTTVGVESKSADYEGKPRITAGDPAGSLLVDLVETRGPGQMPKIGTMVVDKTGAEAIRTWITSMSGDGTPKPSNPDDPNPTTDGGTPAPTGSSCLADSIAEAEANDTAETANAMPGATGTFCGTFAEDTDVDHVAFTAPADFAGISMKLSASSGGAVAIVSANGGAPVQLGQGNPVPAVRGGSYLVKVSGPKGLAYRLTLTLR